MTKEGSTKIVNFNTPRAGVLMLGCGRISHFSVYVLSLSIYSTLIAIVLRDYDAAFRYHSWFSFILWYLLINKYEPFWQEASVKSLIHRWPLRPVGLLFFLSLLFVLYLKIIHFGRQTYKMFVINLLLLWRSVFWIKHWWVVNHTNVFLFLFTRNCIPIANLYIIKILITSSVHVGLSLMSSRVCSGNSWMKNNVTK